MEIIANIKKVEAIAARLLGQENGKLFLGAKFLLGANRNHNVSSHNQT